MTQNSEELLTSVFDRFELLNIPAIQSFNKGITDLELQNLLYNFPFQLPVETKRYFQWRHTTTAEHLSSLLFPHGYINSLPIALEARQTYLQIQDKESIHRNTSDIRSAAISDPFMIRRDSWLWNPRWLPIFSYEGAEEWIILCNEKQVETSPVYFYCVPSSDEFYLAYDSLTTLLLSTVKAYETGAYHIHNGNLYQIRTKANSIINQYNSQRMAYHLKIAGVNTIEDITPLLIHTLLIEDYIRYTKIERTLLMLGDSSSAISLTNYLQHEREVVRVVVANLLGQMGDRNTIEPLTTALRREPLESVRSAIKKALVFTQFVV